MKKRIYLTIDDGPSATTPEKLDWLSERDIPAILFCIGSHIAAQPDVVVDAIRRGFWIGNHAYSHRRFSQLDSETWRNEIVATDALIDIAHLHARIPRARKLFRFPFGDKGGTRRSDAQGLLRALGFQQPPFQGITYGPYLERGYAADADCAWTVESYEYRVPSVDDNLAMLRAPHARTGGSIDDASSADILLIHDHPATMQLFAQIIDHLTCSDVEFTLP